jgi:hypothetical protein
LLGVTIHRVSTMPAIAPAQSTESPDITAWVPSPLYRWSLEQFETMVESAAFSTHDRFHLISGVPVYWIVNLIDRVVEVRIKPTPAGYASCLNYMAGENVPVVVDGVEVGQIAVADILP